MKNPLFNWLDHRAAGVLLHPSSFPGDFGIGTLNDHCHEFIDFLADSGFKYWQICPLGPTGFGDSPYQSFSSFAGNPYLISLRTLHAHGLLDSEVLDELAALPKSFVDYGALYNAKWPVLDAIYERFSQNPEQSLPYGNFSDFKDSHRHWLEPYAFFQALKNHFRGAPWYEWPEEYLSFAKARKSKLRKTLQRDIEAQQFFQYLFFGQWNETRAHANKRGIQIIGDIPIFVALDSADAWLHQQYLQFDPKTARPSAVAGSPPDYFSEDGQLWGNPLYDWEALKADGYSWWIDRLNANLKMCDVLRIDHFRGFDAYWKIPYGSETARSGEWVKGPGIDFFKAIKSKLVSSKLIAEDLGDLTDSVRKLRADTGLPGMAILQFAFGSGSDNHYLPHNLHSNTILYPGTHDNDTCLGWYKSADESVRDHIRRYFDVSGEAIGWDLIRASYRSVSKLAIIPFQDLLSLGSEARFNTPGQAQNNWQWRYLPEQLDSLKGDTSRYLKELAALCYREGKPTVHTF